MANEKKYLIRSQIAQEAGVGLEALRFYERKKILPKPVRSASGYRLYDENQVQRVKFIKKAQILGFTLDEIKEILDLVENPRMKCETVKLLAEQKIREVGKKIADLRNLKNALADLSNRCDSSKDIRHCPIIESLS
jgi:MerR family mercuric resistance operon transcriptional regulator